MKNMSLWFLPVFGLFVFATSHATTEAKQPTNTQAASAPTQPAPQQQAATENNSNANVDEPTDSKNSSAAMNNSGDDDLNTDGIEQGGKGNSGSDFD